MVYFLKTPPPRRRMVAPKYTTGKNSWKYDPNTQDVTPQDDVTFSNEEVESALSRMLNYPDLDGLKEFYSTRSNSPLVKDSAIVVGKRNAERIEKALLIELENKKLAQQKAASIKPKPVLSAKWAADWMRLGQPAMNNEAKKVITSKDVKQAVDKQVLQKKDDFNELKHNWELAIKSVGAIGDAAALASVYGGIRAERMLARLTKERADLMSSGKWGYEHDRYLNELNTKIAKLDRKLNSPNFVQMFGGSLGTLSNGGLLALGDGDLLDVAGLVGGLSSIVGASQILRGGGWGNKADNWFDRLGWGLQGVDLTKTMFEIPTGQNLLPPLSSYFLNNEQNK